MAGASPYEAFEEFRRSIQKAVSCVNSQAHLWAVNSNGYSPGQTHAVTPEGGEPVNLAGERTLRLTSQFDYHIEKAEGKRGPWKVTTEAYQHSLEDENGLEIVAYQWHPRNASAYTLPHLHIGTGIGASLGGIHKYHFPTGRVSLEDVLGLVIREFGVEPVRDDWEDVLRETQAGYEDTRTWPL